MSMKDEQNDMGLAPSVELALDVMEQKGTLSDEQLRSLGLDADALSYCQTLEDANRILNEQIIPMPDVDAEWEKFNFKHGTSKFKAQTLWLLAAAAILLLLILFPWNRHTATEETVAKAGQEDDGMITLVEAVPDDGQITVQAGCRSVAFHDTEESYQSVLANLTDDEKETVIVTIPHGKVYATTLSDGTQVWLNAGSRLLHPYTFKGSQERRVRIEGEAYFKVARDEEHPFVVEMGNSYARVLGTEFNVSTGAELSVVLVSGSVSVGTSQGQEVTLKPGQQAMFNAQSSKFNITEVDTDPYVYWKDGKFYFDDATIEQILTEIGRWYNVTVKLEDPQVLDYRFHFITDRSDSLSDIISLLNQMDKVSIRKEGDVLLVK